MMYSDFGSFVPFKLAILQTCLHLWVHLWVHFNKPWTFFWHTKSVIRFRMTSVTTVLNMETLQRRGKRIIRRFPFHSYRVARLSSRKIRLCCGTPGGRGSFQYFEMTPQDFKIQFENENLPFKGVYRVFQKQEMLNFVLEKTFAVCYHKNHY